MKRIYIILLFISIFSNNLYPQKGTIKIAKPTIPKSIKQDTILSRAKYLRILFSTGMNYSFKGNTKIGYDFETIFPIDIFNSYRYGGYLGLKYSTENQYYQLSPSNSNTSQPEIEIENSENKSEYLRLPLGVVKSLCIGRSTDISLYLGLAPEYLIKTANQYRRLNYSNFNQFNLAGNISIKIPIKEHFGLNLTYSKDFFENLKNKNLYNSGGEKISEQKSKTNLITLSLLYGISYKY